MLLDIRSALTNGDCNGAYALSSRLYSSPYSTNEIRMAHASALGCKADIQMFVAISKFNNFGSGNFIGQFTTIFNSDFNDQRLESAWLALDALQSVLNSGTVVGAADQILPAGYNPGSVISSDRSDSSNVFNLFVSMAIIGDSLARFGRPDLANNHTALVQHLPWQTQGAVMADTTGSACGLAAGFLNLFDSFDEIAGQLNPSAASAMNVVISKIRSPILDGPYVDPITSTTFNIGGNSQCLTDMAADPVTNPVRVELCRAAKARLRYRGACTENKANASYAAGIIMAVDQLWALGI
jgi:hypothetical protein